MNFDELSSPPRSPSPSSFLDVNDHLDLSRQSSIEEPRVPSISSDAEWVSPFTVLPPLPALRKNRNLLRSPDDRLHERSSSSAYYAAAWGSPYASPSPNTSPATEKRKRGSEDLESSSPLSVRDTQKTATGSSFRNRARNPGDRGIGSARLRPRASSWDRQKSISERFNWLSESDISGDEDGKAGKTPTRRTYLKTAEINSPVTAKKATAQGHQGRDSTATITPDTFHATAAPTLDEEVVSVASLKMEEITPDAVEARPGSTPVDKPLPELPLPGTSTNNVIIAKAPSPERPSRPRMASVQSFQRPKKKVPWRGKTCIIALPLVDRETAGLPPLLTAREIDERMQKWVADGYTTKGFTLGDSQYDIHQTSGQSKALFPDPIEMSAEREKRPPQVHIPNQGEWDAWVEYLKEEKLRALGVTPSNSEAPQSTQSPFSSTLSRVSSAFPSLAPSPPISTLSSNGNPLRIASATFSPPLSHPSGMNSQGGSHVASPLGGMVGPSHGYKQSVALPRMSSPFDYPVSQPNVYGQNMRQTPSALSMRQFSPPVISGLQNMNQILSPMVPTVPSNDSARGSAQGSSMDQIVQQQQKQQQIHAQMLQQKQQQQQKQHQRQQSLFPPPSKTTEAPRTPQILESPTRSTPEIMHPTPRSHRHNLSAALQKGVDDAEAARSGDVPPSQDGDSLEKNQTQSNATIDEVEDQDQDQEELPVLRRPETYDADDKSEIETNPSIAASPQLMDETNPFGNLTSLKDILTTRPQHQTHKSSSSISKFNVDAPAFSPSKAGFSFNPATAAAFAPPHSNNPSITRLTHKSKQSSLSRFNVDAPSFMPSFMKQATPETSSSSTPIMQPVSGPEKPAPKPAFTFGPSALNVEAPVFKPGQTFSFNAAEFTPAQPLKFETDKPSFPSTPHHTSSGSIFGSVFIDPSAKANRRTNKALPILPPASREGTPKEATDVDEDGRASAPADRQKRARRVDEDGDEAPAFAASAPFDAFEGLSTTKDVAQEPIPDVAQPEEKGDTILTDTRSEPPLKDQPEDVKDVQDVKPMATPEPEIEVIEDSEPASQDQHATEDEAKAYAPVIDVDKAIEVSEKAAEGQDGEIEEVIEVIEEVSSDSQKSRSSSRASNHGEVSSLSALASPFQPAPVGAPPKPKKTGLKASKFAGSPPPQLSAGLRESKFAAPSHPSPPPVDVAKPPQNLYEYVKPEDVEPKSRSVDEKQEIVYDGTTPRLPNVPFDATPDLMKSVEESMRAEREHNASAAPSERSRVNETMPSYEEIDAVMKQFEDNPDLGIERQGTPVKNTPLVDMRLPATFRSDAPSPSPSRLREAFRQQSPQRRADFGLGIHKLHDSHGEISDWGNDYSPSQEDKIRARAGFFDGHVNELFDGIIENRLEPLERSLQTIQHSITVLATKPSLQGRRSLSTGNRDSDADDEDDYNEFEGFSQSYRSRSPSRKDKKTDVIRNAVIDAMAAYRSTSEPPAFDMTEIRAALDEMRQLSQQSQAQADIKHLIDQTISSHPRFKSPPIKSDDQEALQETFKLKTDVLESSLKAAEEKAEQESKLRKQTEDDLQAMNRKLIDAQDVAHRNREAHEEAQLHHVALSKEQERSRLLEARLAEAESKISQLGDKNSKLEELADEYRMSKDDWREQLHKEQSRNQDLVFTLQMIKAKHSDRDESRQALREQVERLREKMSSVMHDVSAEEAEWRKREHELIIANQRNQAALDHEIRHRQNVDLQLSNLTKEHEENIRFRSMHEHSQHEITRLHAEINQLRQETKSHQDDSFQRERELVHLKTTRDSEIANSTARLQFDLETAKVALENMRSDSESQIRRLELRLETADKDLVDQKSKHGAVMNEIIEAHRQALFDVNKQREEALETQRNSQESKLQELRESHNGALRTSSDDKNRTEQHLSEKIKLSEDKVKHLEGKVSDLEERLEITKSAARAAVEAATAKGVNIPTPAPSVVASPPQRAGSASMSMIKGTDIPERISPQALRESIMVLQDQLQHREQKIEGLEQELAAIDKDAPAKLKERDNEINMLRELLSVRVDDLEEIIATLSKPSYDREATKDAAIRLRANLQMQQQLRERAVAVGNASTSTSSGGSITNLTQSPRGLPMAAAAAWGNWRKARDFSANALNTIAGTNSEQTPSRSGTTSPSGFLAGVMTPPATSQRTPSPSHVHPFAPPSMRPLAPSSASRKPSAPSGPARPLRGYSSQPRALSNRQAEKRRESNESAQSRSNRRLSHGHPQPPMTPVTNKSSDSSLKSLDFGDDIDEDASSFSGSGPDHDDLEDTPQATRSVTGVRGEV